MAQQTTLESKKITFVTMDDWEGLYINGKIVLQDHRLTAREVLSALKIRYKDEEADSDWGAERGDLPDQLKEVKFDGNKGDI